MDNKNIIVKYTSTKDDLKYYTVGSVGIDLHLRTFVPLDRVTEMMFRSVDGTRTIYRLAPFGRAKCGSGIAIELPKGFEGQVRGRSSSTKDGLLIQGGVGTIDSDYRGQIYFVLHNLTNEIVEVNVDHRYAQLIISAVPDVELVRVIELSKTLRDASGFGSTGD